MATACRVPAAAAHREGLPRRLRQAVARRRGFTLIEMLIVLVIVVVVIGASWPRLRTAWSKAELRSAARSVRVAMSQARLDAIDSGAPRQFRYQPGGSLYEVGVYTLSDDALLAAAPDSTSETPAAQYELPHGVRFVVTSPTAEPVSPEAASDQWSEPLLFYPNGCSANAKLRLSGDEELYVNVVLRGVTGVAKVGPVEREKTLP